MKLILLFLSTFFLIHCNSYGLYDKLTSNSSNSGSNAACFDNGTGIVKNGLMAYWNLNGNFNDKWDCGTGFQFGSGSNFSFVTDRFGIAGNAVNLAASTGIVNFGNLPEYQTSPFTLCSWIRLPSGGTANGLVGKYTGTTGWRLDAGSTTMDVYLDNAGAVGVSTGSWSTVWYYACLVYDSAASPAITAYRGVYSGGIISASGAGSFTGTATNLALNPNAWSAALEYDDVAFYRRALTAAEVQQNFTATEQ